MMAMTCYYLNTYILAVRI